MDQAEADTEFKVETLQPRANIEKQAKHPSNVLYFIWSALQLAILFKGILIWIPSPCTDINWSYYLYKSSP